MPMEEINGKRAKDGKFLPGNKPPKSPGRPPGPNGVKARAARLAGDCLEQLLGKAVDVIDEALDNGDSHVATWLVDRIRPPGRSDYAHLPDTPALSSIEDIIDASENVASAAVRGEVSLQHAKALQDILQRHADVKGLEAVAKLRADLEALQMPRAPMRVPKLDLPTWGRLREAAE